MIRSMTGFGESERDFGGGAVRVEIRTVNHRNLNLHLRMPHGLERFETEVQGWLRGRFSRGHVKYALTIDRDSTAGGAPLPELDLERARAYRQHLETLKEELDLHGEIEVGTLVRFGELFRAQPETDEPDIEAELIQELTAAAAAANVAMREAEGVRLREDLEERLEGISRALESIEALAPERLSAERERLRTAIRELTEREDVDEDRLAREIAYLAEKWDINEEIVRFRSHLEQFQANLAIEPPEPVGKRLGFILQEMQREANTIGSKANNVEIGQAVVSIKEEIERLREQLENVE